jgi:hypothetical protein
MQSMEMENEKENGSRSVQTVARIMFEELEAGLVGAWRYIIFEGLSASGRQVYWLNVYPYGSIRSADLNGPNYSSIEQARSEIPNAIYRWVNNGGHPTAGWES